MSLEVFTFSFWQTRDLFHLGPSKRKEETLDEVPLKLLTLMLGGGAERYVASSPKATQPKSKLGSQTCFGFIRWRLTGISCGLETRFPMSGVCSSLRPDVYLSPFILPSQSS